MASCKSKNAISLDKENITLWVLVGIMKMRIALVTLFDNGNFGNRLQNYALKKTLKTFSESVTTIKNKPRPSGKIKEIVRKSPWAESAVINRLIGKTRKAEYRILG